MKIVIHQSKLELIQGDITESGHDAVVNAANSQLILGAGVAGAIRKKGGPAIQEECDRIGGCPVGGAVITCGGNLKARHVIHAVGPKWGEGDEENKLRDATRNSLRRAEENNLTSIAFPAISTGIYGFPLERAAKIMLETVHGYLSQGTGIRNVTFSLFDPDSLRVFEKNLRALTGQ